VFPICYRTKTGPDCLRQPDVAVYPYRSSAEEGNSENKRGIARTKSRFNSRNALSWMKKSHYLMLSVFGGLPGFRNPRAFQLLQFRPANF
jgi:hypothetical protein